MTKRIFLVVSLFLWFTWCGFSQGLVINEIITSNSSVLADDDGSYEDWIELYNGSAENINLNGYGLTDNSNLYQWVFPEKIIAPGEYLLIWCSDKNRTAINAPLHTNFKISSGGETITLTDNMGNVVDSVPPVLLPQNYTYGRYPDGTGDFLIFGEPTPGTPNTSTGYTEILQPPSISVPSGFYTEAFSLSISAPPGTTIIYTTDGSEPDENNLNGTTYQYKNEYPQFPEQDFGPLLNKSYISYVYTAPIIITERNFAPNDVSSIATSYWFDTNYLQNYLTPKGTVIRAKAVKAGAMASATVTANYFISPAGSNWFSLPVAAISVNANDMFDYNEGIHVPGVDFDQWRTENPAAAADFANANYHRGGDDWEIKGNLNYFNNSQEVLNQDIGIRINGGYSAMAPSKSLRLVARQSYGNPSMDYNFFGNNYNSYKRLVLRNSGNDFASTMFRDAFIQTAVSHLSFETQAYQPTVTFVNGEYWGLLNLREKYDKYYFERVFGIEEDELDYFENNVVKEGDYEHYNAMISFIENNPLNNPANYSHVTTLLDPINFADYQITQIYIDNKDWPGNNIEYFRKRTGNYMPNAPSGQDGRWRWILKDTDFGMGLAGSYQYNTLAFATEVDGPEYPNPAWSTFLLRNMLENDEFKNYFINRFADLLNTTFLPERMSVIYNTLRNGIAPEMERQRNRWPYMGTEADWNTACTVLSTFIDQRPIYQRAHIRDKFNISANVQATLKISGNFEGHIRINTIDIKETTPGISQNPYPWEGTYFHNIPITLTAVPAPGYEFSHWSGDVAGTDMRITYIPTADFEATANFIPTETPEITVPIYFWAFGNSVPNDTALTSINATYPATSGAVLNFESCLVGYPFTNGHPNWRKASMERRNSPTEINYLPEANNGILFAAANMRGIQIKQPFVENENENTMVFTLPTTAYENIQFAFAAKDEGAAQGISLEYSVTEPVVWQNTGLAAPIMPLTGEYQLFNTDFSNIDAAENNADFKIRLRFTGTTSVDNGERVTFNNISLMGVAAVPAGNTQAKILNIAVYPNPFCDDLYIQHQYDKATFSLYSIDGKLIKSGTLLNTRLSLSELQAGLYLLQLSADNKTITRKIIKK